LAIFVQRFGSAISSMFVAPRLGSAADLQTMKVELLFTVQIPKAQRWQEEFKEA
jgi:hypothetical protein